MARNSFLTIPTFCLCNSSSFCFTQLALPSFIDIQIPIHNSVIKGRRRNMKVRSVNSVELKPWPVCCLAGWLCSLKEREMEEWLRVVKASKPQY